MNLKKRLFFRISHFVATLLPNTLGRTGTYHQIITPFELPSRSKVFLGPMLLNSDKGLYHRYYFKTVCERENIKVVVRTLEDFERQYRLWGGVHAATLEQYHQAQITVIDMSIRDFIQHFKHTEPKFVEKLFVAIKKIYALQEQGSNVYFHCKAGKNRSFKALTCYLVYAQLKKMIDERNIDHAHLKKLIHNTCHMIREQRPQIIFKTKKQQKKHERFVYECFKLYLASAC